MSDFLGKTIGDFQLVELLDEHGETMVFKGFQPSMNRYVAIKILKPGAARDPNALQRFLQQGEVLARLHHPYILDVITSGQEEGIYFRAERLAEGLSLQDQLYQFKDEDAAVGLIEKIVQALEYIHSQGYVHGNLRPGNILLDSRQSPLLADFGTPPHQTQLPSPFLAPEQIGGGVVDYRTDVYALGVLAFTVLAGQAPPPRVVVSLRSYRPDLPEALERTILKASAQNPDQRFQTPGEFLAALKNALQEPAQAQSYLYQPTPVPTSMPSVSQSVIVEGQKSRTSWLAVVLGILVISILCIGGFLVFRYLVQEQRSETGEMLPGLPPSGPTIIVPTVVLPTREPRPTLPVLEPTAPAEEPNQPPVEPTDEPQPDDYPPALTEESPDGPGGQLAGKLPDSCGSIGFITVGTAMVVSTRRRKQLHRQ